MAKTFKYYSLHDKHKYFNEKCNEAIKKGDQILLDIYSEKLRIVKLKIWEKTFEEKFGK